VSSDDEGGEHRRAVRRVLEVLPLLMRRWERDARATPWPGELSGGLADALATAIAVAGSQGIELVEPLAGYEALVIDWAGRKRCTSDFPFAPAAATSAASAG